MPPSPSPIPSYALSSTTAPKFMMATSPSPTPSLTVTMPVSPQQHCDDVFYEGVDGIRASTTQLQVAARCLLARRQGQCPIFKRQCLAIPTTLQQLVERKAIARASACKVSAARGLLVRRGYRRCASRRSGQPWWRLTSAHGGTTSPSRTTISNRVDQLSTSASMVRVPRAMNSNSMAAAVGKALPSLSSARAYYLAPPLFATSRHEGTSVGHCCDTFQGAIHVLPFRPDGVHGIQVVAHVQVQGAEGVRLISRGQKESRSE
jgi:hypothetical protein